MRQYRWRPSGDGVHVCVARPWVEQAEGMVRASAYLTRLERACGGVFERSNERWGFGGALLRVESEQDVCYAARFHYPPRVTSASLHLLCATLLGSFDLATEEMPLISLQGLRQSNGNSGWDMGAGLSPAMQLLLDRFTTGDVERVTACLQTTGVALGLREGLYGARIQATRLFLTVPGEETWLGGYETFPSKEHPLWLSGHNIDTAAQQFVFLRALAEVHAIAEAYESPSSPGF